MAQQDVLGLEIAMNDPMPMRVVQRARDRCRDPQRLVDRKLLFAAQSSAETLTLDERHYIEQMPVRFAGIEQWQEVRMRQPGGRLDFGEKSLDPQHRAELRTQYFERDTTVMPEIAREVHGRHPAAPNLAIDRVPSSKRRVELRGEIHGLIREDRRSERRNNSSARPDQPALICRTVAPRKLNIRYTWAIVSDVL